MNTYAYRFRINIETKYITYMVIFKSLLLKKMFFFQNK